MADDTPPLPTDHEQIVDLAPCNFGGTFRNPCFWVLLGVGLGAFGAWWLVKSTERKG